MARAPELVEAARILVAAGRWERAESLLAPDRDNPDVLLALAEVSVDAALWRAGSARGAASDRAAELLLRSAVAVRGAEDGSTCLLVLRHRHQRLLADPQRDLAAARALVNDLATLAAQSCDDCEPTSGWNSFYLGLAHEALLDDPRTAAPLYAAAEKQARLRGDRLAESYPLRHLAAAAARAGRSAEALHLAYTSLTLRQATGAAPAVAAQQLMVAELELATSGPSRGLSALVDAAAETARALDLRWVAASAASLQQELAA